MRKLVIYLGCIISVILVSCQTNRSGELAEAGPTGSVYWVGVNKFHCPGSMSNNAAPARVQLPRSLSGVSGSVLLQNANPLRHGVPSFSPAYPHLRLPEDAFLLTLALSDRPPLRRDATSVVNVTEPSFCFVYPPGTRVVILQGYFNGAGEWLDMMPVQLQAFMSMDQRPVRTAPPGAREITGQIEEPKVQSFISSL